MGNTKDGGRKYAETMAKKYGSREKWIKQLRIAGSKGGTKSRKGGFASNKVGADGLTGRERARVVSRFNNETKQRKEQANEK